MVLLVMDNLMASAKLAQNDGWAKKKSFTSNIPESKIPPSKQNRHSGGFED